MNIELRLKKMETFESALEKIEKSEAFEKFKQRYKDAELCVGFFVIDYQGQNQQQLDYCLKDGKIFTFIINKEITIKEAETLQGKQNQKLEKLDKEIKVDLDDVEKILQEKTKGEKNKLNKIIAVLQKYNNKQIWNLNCMLEGLIILHVNIDSISGEVLKYEKKSMFDFVKRVK